MSNGEEDPPKTPSPLLYDLGVPFEQLDPVKFLFFATLLFFTEAALYYPVDVLRTRLQVQRQVPLSHLPHSSPPELKIIFNFVAAFFDLEFHSTLEGAWPTVLLRPCLLIPLPFLFFPVYPLVADLLLLLCNSWLASCNRGWFRGFIASSSGAPSYGLYFVTYNYFKDKFQHINDQSTPNLEHRAGMNIPLCSLAFP